jgi:hypothetical protein
MKRPGCALLAAGLLVALLLGLGALALADTDIVLGRSIVGLRQVSSKAPSSENRSTPMYRRSVIHSKDGRNRRA